MLINYIFFGSFFMEQDSFHFDTLFKPGRLQIFFNQVGFGSVVFSIARGPGASSIPHTQRVPHKGGVPPPSKLGRMECTEHIEEKDELICCTFEPVKNFRPILGENWGANVTDIEIVAFINGQKQVLKTYESCFDVEIQQQNKRYPKFHASTKDKRMFFELTIPPADLMHLGWEVKRAMMLLHKKELMKLVEDVKQSDEFHAGFFTNWGQSTPMAYWGKLSSVVLTEYAAQSMFLYQGPLNIEHEESIDDVVSEESIPPSGVICCSFRDFCYAGAFEREFGQTKIRLQILSKASLYFKHITEMI